MGTGEIHNATTRFSDRVENYIKYRPDYPDQTLACLEQAIGLKASSIVADIGSGTGISARIFLENGNMVYGVEPNTAMRKAAEECLAEFKKFRSIDGTAELTTLEEGSVDVVTAGQAFHWFDAEKAKLEFKRILKPAGYLVLFWNNRQIATTPFLEDYELLLQDYGTDYKQVNHRNVALSNNDKIAVLFKPNGYELKVFPNQQAFDFEGIKGRMLSSSYVPGPDNSNYQPMLEKLEEIFNAHQENNQVVIKYDTQIYYGQLV